MEQFKYSKRVTFLKAEASKGLRRCNSACVGFIIRPRPIMLA